MEKLNVENLEKTLIVIKDVMCDDLIQSTNSECIQKMSRIVLSSEKFLNSIKNDISAVMADGKITMSDLPRMISILLKSSTFLNSLKKSVSNVEFKMVPMNAILRYSSFALFYYLMLNDDTNQEDIDSFLLLYPSLWTLVELSLPKHDDDNEFTDSSNKKEKVNTGCC
jgi:hypothetical protein